MIRDLLKRKKISTSAHACVNKYFSNIEKRKIEELDSKKASKRLQKLTKQLKFEANMYFNKNDLGIYGKAKYAKEIQNALESSDFDSDVISYVVNSIVRG